MTNDKVDILTPDQVWQTALGELQLQLTGATFDTWLGRTRLVSGEDGTFIVGVHNKYAKDWLENRLLSMIKRTLTGLVGRSVEVRFVVWNKELESGESGPLLQSQASPPTEAQIRFITDTALPTAQSAPVEPRGFILPDFDPKEAGWFDVTGYASTFWAALLGRIAWRVWEIVREADHRRDKSEWTPARRWTAPRLAELVPCGRQALIGFTREGRHSAGAFGRLEELGIAQVQRQGMDPHIIYTLSMQTRLALLMPAQVQQLSENLRIKHDRWLEEHGFDPKEWFPHNPG